jgi:hypothetical protein
MVEQQDLIKKIVEITDNLSGDVKAFYNFHGVQLVATRFPPFAEKVDELYQLLKSERFEAGDYFEILENQEEELFE